MFHIKYITVDSCTDSGIQQPQNILYFQRKICARARVCVRAYNKLLEQLTTVYQPVDEQNISHIVTDILVVNCSNSLLYETTHTHTHTHTHTENGLCIRAV